MDVTFVENEMFFLSDVPNHVIQGENEVREAQNWFEVEIRGIEAQDFGTE